MRHMGLALAAAAALVALSLVVVVGCGGNGGAAGGGSDPPPAAVDITGRLSQFSAAADGTVSFLVVATQTSHAGYDRAMVRTTVDTVVWSPIGEGRRSVAVGDLHDGLQVAVRFAGPVAESYPVQAVAADVEVLSTL